MYKYITICHVPLNPQGPMNVDKQMYPILQFKAPFN